ncbi:hypothetical protein BDB01DRAFT_395094 [Pilobolus umbonatus]|nr:hypothetical protein BDB01DRAFT_395094 [Pilobolus umbonatus]
MKRTLKKSLANYTEKRKQGPMEFLFTFAYNTAKQASSGYSPYELMFGRRVVLPI